MKRFKQLLLITLLFFTKSSFSQTGIFRVNGDPNGPNKGKSVQIGYNDYRLLTFGFGNLYNNHEQGQWGIEH